MKDIVGYEGIYKVTKEGKIWSKNKQDFMSLVTVRSGVERVSLFKGGVRKEYAVHRLVAEAFIPNPHNKAQVDHIDGDKQHNAVINLRWCTNEENQAYRDEQNSSGQEYGRAGIGKAIKWGEEEFTSIKNLSRHIAGLRGSRPETVLKELKAVRYGAKIMYGKMCSLVD